MAVRASFVLLLATWLSACGARDERQIVTLGGESMGSTWSIQAVTNGEWPDDRRRELERDIAGILHRVDSLMSTWNPRSELSRLNEAQSVERFPVAPETFAVFQHAVALARESNGAFDITVGGLVEAWGFGPAAASTPAAPDPAILARLRDAVGINRLELDPGGRWVRKRHVLVRCDVSGLAPGYAADRIAMLLEAYDLRDFLVDVGGEMVARGGNADGQPWRVAIELPQDVGDLARPALLDRVVPLTDAAMATSGDYRNYREIDGVRVTHIIDPRSGRPIDHRLASATVVTDRAVRADALATALMVLGPEDGMALAERLNVAALLLVRVDEGRFEQRRSPRMNVLLGGR